MTGKGKIASIPNRRIRAFVGVHLLWLAIVSLLGAWWSQFALNLAERIARLDGNLAEYERTKRMITWEAGAFFLLLMVTTGFLVWLYWRDAKRSKALQAFFASVTHELRTPLTSIRLQAESIAENLSGDQSQKQLVDRLLQDTMRLESQVNRTLELARVEGGGAIYRESVRLKPWLERQIKNWEENYGGRARFTTAIEDVSIEADTSALQVILRNLLENSIRHSQREPVEVSLEARADGRAVLVVFRDNGVGYSDDPRKLGEIFHKGAESQGAGVGLYLIRILMERMSGHAGFAPSSGGFVAQLQFERAHG